MTRRKKNSKWTILPDPRSTLKLSLGLPLRLTIAVAFPRRSLTHFIDCSRKIHTPHFMENEPPRDFMIYHMLWRSQDSKKLKVVQI